MNAKDEPLGRLLRAAARAPQPTVEPLSPQEAARLLSLRPPLYAGGDWLLLETWLRRGFAVACALAAVAVTLNLQGMLTQPEDDLASWNTIANLTWMP